MQLSIIIPARNEMFLARTIQDILAHIEADTEIIAVLDGQWASPQLTQHPRVNVIFVPTPIGHRACTNLGVKLSRAKYIMKVDAHCSFDQGFDRKMISEMRGHWTMVPVMRNLHAFDWKCKNGHTRYQGPSGPCKECGEPTEMDMKWIGKTNPQSTSYRFDKNMKFQYFSRYKKKQKGPLVETMSLQGSCFMCTRDKFLELNLCEERFGMWGQQGTEVACKTWLSGGRVIVNKNTWYAHLFRTQGGDFGFPYTCDGRSVDRAKRLCREYFVKGKWPKMKREFKWLIDRFSPVPEWEAA